MSPKLSRILAAGLAACTGLTGGAVLLTCDRAAAQVGPSRANVKKKPAPKKPAPKKPAPKKPAPRKPAGDVPVVKVRTVPAKPKPNIARVKPKPKPPVTAVKPPVAKPPVTAVKIKPPIRVPRPNSTDIARRAAEAEAAAARERLRIAATWQQGELEAFEALAQLSGQAKATPLDRILIPPVPKPGPAPAGRTTYRQKVTLLFLREDGMPFTGALASRTPGSLKLTESGNRMEFEGPRVNGADALLQVGLPADWGFVKPEDAQVRLSDYPGQERVVTEESSAATAPTVVKAAPLFSDADEETAARKAIPAVAHKRVIGGTYARPGAAALNVLGTLALVRNGLDKITPSGSVEARRKNWAELERISLLLDDAALSLSEARSVARDFNPTAAQTVLKSGFQLDYTRLADAFALADLRLAQYRGETEWLRAQVVAPDAPNRTRALQALAEAPEAVVRNPEVAAQLARYKEAAEAEGKVRTLLQSGALNPPPPRDTTITRHLTRTVVVQKSAFEVRFAEADLRRGDRVLLDGTPVSFDLRRGYWVARIPRAMIKTGGRLEVRRGSGDTEAAGELPLPQLNAYAAAGNLLKAPELQAVRKPVVVAVAPPPVIPMLPAVPAGPARLAVTAGPLGEIPLFRELSPDLVRSLRREGEEEEERDGATWLTLRSVPLSLRLQRIDGQAPAAEKGKKKAEVSRVKVVAVRMEGPTAGEVNGIRVGSSSRAAQDAFRIPVERTGPVSLMDGAIQLVLREGIVHQILVTREVVFGR